MKNQLLASIALLGLFAFTATGAQAHTVHGAGGYGPGGAHSAFHGGGTPHAWHNGHNRYFYRGAWYDYDPACVFVPGISLNFSF